MRRRYFFYLFLAMCGIADVRAGQDVYNPLAVGLQWDVDVVVKSRDGKKSEGSVTREISGTEKINGLVYFVVNTNFTGLPEMKDFTTYRRKSVRGIFAISALDKSRQEYLEAALPLVVGQGWKTIVSGMMIETMVEGTEAVTIGDKTYDNCMKISYKSRDGRVSGTYYQAPDVGNVKEETSSPAGIFTFTLKKFSGLK